MIVKIKLLDKAAAMPERATEGAAGYDLRACLSSYKVIEPGDRALIPTGIAMEIPPGYEGQVRTRSGLAIKEGIVVLNSPGTIDSDYRGEVMVVLANVSDKKYCVTMGQRIAQLVFAKVEYPSIDLTNSFGETTRGIQGFGSTGV